MRQIMIRVLAISAFVTLSSGLVVRINAATPEPGTPVTAQTVQGMLAGCEYDRSVPIPGAERYFAEFGLGAAPVWLVQWGIPPEEVLANLDESASAPTPDRPYLTPSEFDPYDPDFGWFFKGLWVIEGTWEEPVQVSGERVGDGFPMHVKVVRQSPAAEVILDPADPGVPGGDGTWREFPSSLHFLETGCYELSAEWSTGSWTVTIPFVAPDDVLDTLDAATPVAGTPSA